MEQESIKIENFPFLKKVLDNNIFNNKEKFIIAKDDSINNLI